MVHSLQRDSAMADKIAEDGLDPLDIANSARAAEVEHNPFR